jgi:hypothetical protein
MRKESPGEWQEAIEFDERNRCNPLAGDGGTADQIFIYKHGGPLAQADLEGDAEREKIDGAVQMPLLCGDGPCWT